MTRLVVDHDMLVDRVGTVRILQKPFMMVFNIVMMWSSNIWKWKSYDSATLDCLLLWLLDNLTCFHEFERAKVRLSYICFLLLSPQYLQGWGIVFVFTNLSLFVIHQLTSGTIFVKYTWWWMCFSHHCHLFIDNFLSGRLHWTRTIVPTPCLFFHIIYEFGGVRLSYRHAFVLAT